MVELELLDRSSRPVSDPMYLDRNLDRSWVDRYAGSAQLRRLDLVQNDLKTAQEVDFHLKCSVAWLLSSDLVDGSAEKDRKRTFEVAERPVKEEPSRLNLDAVEKSAGMESDLVDRVERSAVKPNHVEWTMSTRKSNLIDLDRLSRVDRPVDRVVDKLVNRRVD